MDNLLSLRWLFLLILVSNVEAHKNPSLSIDTICLGNIMRVDVGPLGGKLLEVAVSINNSVVVLTPSLASQCGFRVKTDKPGNTLIYASLPNCFAQNVEDKMFTTTLQLRVHGNRFAEDELYQVTETCHYTAWASREIVCNNNFMEVSVKRAAPHDYTLPRPPMPQADSQSVTSRRAAEKLPIDAGFQMTTVVFFTPAGEKTMSVADAHRNGYGLGNTPTRLVLRSPMMAPETYTQNVAGVTMNVFKTSTIFEKKWLATQIDTTAACPVMEGSVFFTSDTITWYLPRQISPMISSDHFNLLEVHFGLNGQRLDTEMMHAQQCSLSLNDLYIIVQIPIGAVGGHYKSHIQQNQYYVSYVIEPMLEMIWTEDSPHEQTRYKVLFHIATHLLPRPLQFVDETIPAAQMFKLVLGHFALDVALINITFPSEVLTMTDCSARGFNIMEHISVNGSTKLFALQIPFTDPVVSKQMRDGVVVYSLHLTFGLLVLDSFVTFSHTAQVEAVLQDMAVPPSVSGGCDHQNFYVLVKYGTQSFSFQTTVGKQLMTPSLAEHYNYMENGTHFSFTVPFSAPDVAVEAVESSSIRSRLDVVLSNPETNTEIQDFSLVCNFPSGLTECFPNGTMTALAVKVDSVPALNPRLLTLRDPNCGPVYSNDHYAYFVFTVNSCGTTRKFLPDSMLYENEISLPDGLEMKLGSDLEAPEYELKISCFYDINTSHAVGFYTRLRRSEPYAENSEGHLQIEMRLALDDSYSKFQTVEDYPIAKYLQQPLYFEVQLKSTNPKVSLQLENCWATQYEDRNSQPRWNLIINGCPNPVDTYQVVFHPVQADSRVQYPSHLKRFEVQMFAFAEGQDDLSSQLFVHCDIVICDAKNLLDGVCGGQCPNPENGAKSQRHVSDFNHVSAGPIIIN